MSYGWFQIGHAELELPAFAIGKVMLQCEFDWAERQLVPGYFCLIEEFNFQAFNSGRKIQIE
jgi:hypothetical protein